VKKRFVRLISVVLFSLMLVTLLTPMVTATAAGPEYTFTSTDYVSPEGQTAYSTCVTGINAGGEVVGQFNWSVAYPPPSYLPNFHGFLLSEGKWTVLDYPNAISTSPTGISPSGVVVGYYINADTKSHGFRWTKENGFLPVDYPGYAQTQLNAIGVDGTMYGVAWNTVLPTGAWVDSHSIVILPNGNPLDTAEMLFTVFTRATPNGNTMAGIYRPSIANPTPPPDKIAPPPNKACIIENGIATPLTLTSLGLVTYSSAWGISPSGNKIVGMYGTEPSYTFNWAGHSFIGERTGKGKEWQFSEFKLPDPTITATRIFDINAGGVLVGGFNYTPDLSKPASYAWHGFIATPITQ
jgi:hypothetical protein